MRLTVQEHAEVDRFAGNIRLALPRRLQLKLHDVFVEELKLLPPATAAEIEHNILAQIALTLKSSNTAAIYQAEAARLNDRADQESRTAAFVSLENAKRIHGEAFDAFTDIVFAKRSTAAQCEAAYTALVESVAHDPNALDLLQWAKRNIEKRNELKGKK